MRNTFLPLQKQILYKKIVNPGETRHRKNLTPRVARDARQPLPSGQIEILSPGQWRNLRRREQFIYL